MLILISGIILVLASFIGVVMIITETLRDK
jgi:hypothetical protein